MRYLSCCYLLLSLLLLFPAGALAIPTITCHCFTDRSFDPARPALADPYFLATTQNSFFAAVFAVEKKSIVLKKQQGTGADDLWVAYWLGTRAKVAPETLLQAKKAKESWQEVAAAAGLPGKKLGVRFAAALKARVATGRLAETVVDELFLEYRLLSEAELTALRKDGATNQALILAALLAHKTRQPASQLFREVGSGAKSWGALLDRAKIDPSAIPHEIQLFLKPPR